MSPLTPDYAAEYGSILVCAAIGSLSPRRRRGERVEWWG